MSKVIADTIQGRSLDPTVNDGLTIVGVLTCNSDVSVGGTITYEDVTNVDSVGVITARTGVKVTAGGIDIAAGGLEVTGISTVGHVYVVGILTSQSNIHLLDDDKLQLGGTAGTVDGMEIFHDGSHSIIDDVGTGSLVLRSDTSLKLLKRTGDENMLIANPDSSVDLYFDTGLKLATTNTGTLVSGVSSCYGLSITKGLVEEKGKFDSGGSPSGTFNHDVLDYGMVYRTDANMAGTFTINLRGDGSTTFNSIMQIGQSSAFTFYHGTNNTSYVLQNFQIDGVNQTEKWNGGSAPSAASSSGTDVYTFNILKTADATYTVFATFSNFV